MKSISGHNCLNRRFFLTSVLGAFLLHPFENWAVAAEHKKQFLITIKNGHVPKKEQTIKVMQGDVVEIKFTSDRAMVLHLHGINKQVKISPEKPGLMSFDAKIAGRFPIEVHGKGAHGNLMYVEVHPR